MSPSTTRNASWVVTAGLVVLGVVLIVVGILYLTRTAAEFQSFFPGHQAGSSHYHSKHGVLALILGLVALVGACREPGRAGQSGNTPQATRKTKVVSALNDARHTHHRCTNCGHPLTGSR